MKRLVEELEDGRCKITEKTGEIHYTVIDRFIPDGYRDYWGTVLEILTQEQIDTTPLPYFDLDRWDTYPKENEKIMMNLFFSHNFLGQSICERVARIKLAQKLGMFDVISDDTENN